jgi:cysteine desulfuration protein SufE
MPIEFSLQEGTNDKIVFTGRCDAILTKGIIDFNNSDFLQSKASDILEAEMDFIDQIG